MATKIKKPYCKDINEFDENSPKPSSAVRLSFLILLLYKSYGLLIHSPVHPYIQQKILYFADPDYSGFAFIVMILSRNYQNIVIS